VIAKSTLREFWEKHPDAAEALQAWYDDVERLQWKSPADIRTVYASASFLANNRVVFNICGNHYRLVTHIHYNTQIVYLRFVGTHAEYDFKVRNIGLEAGTGIPASALKKQSSVNSEQSSVRSHRSVSRFSSPVAHGSAWRTVLIQPYELATDSLQSERSDTPAKQVA